MPPIAISAAEEDEELFQLCPILGGEITLNLEQELEEKRAEAEEDAEDAGHE
jgi:hypothetical protein